MGFLEEETEDRIVLKEDILSRILISLFFIAFGAIWIWYLIVSYSPDAGWGYVTSLLLRLGLILVVVTLIILGLKAMFISESVILDKKIQSVIIKKKIYHRKFGIYSRNTFFGYKSNPNSKEYVDKRI